MTYNTQFEVYAGGEQNLQVFRSRSGVAYVIQQIAGVESE